MPQRFKEKREKKKEKREKRKEKREKVIGLFPSPSGASGSGNRIISGGHLERSREIFFLIEEILKQVQDDTKEYTISVLRLREPQAAVSGLQAVITSSAVERPFY